MALTNQPTNMNKNTVNKNQVPKSTALVMKNNSGNNDDSSDSSSDDETTKNPRVLINFKPANFEPFS